MIETWKTSHYLILGELTGFLCKKDPHNNFLIIQPVITNSKLIDSDLVAKDDKTLQNFPFSISGSNREVFRLIYPQHKPFFRSTDLHKQHCNRFSSTSGR
jgi:hypothetical protein